MTKYQITSNKITPETKLSDMKKSLIITLLVIFIAFGNAIAQQIPMFSSYTLNKFLLNPSYAGSNGKTNIYGINRLQYAGFEGAPVTFMLTADAGFKDKKFGLGGLFFSDRSNLMSQTGFQAAYSYNIKLSETWNLGMGLNAGMVQWRMNFDQLIVDDPSEVVISNQRQNATTFRSDIGFRINSDKIDFGVSLPQIVSSKVNYTDYLTNKNGKYATVPHYVANLSYLFAVNENFNLKPMVVVRGAGGIKPQIDIIGFMDWKDMVFASVGYRTNYAVSIGAGLHVAKGVTFGYSYDRPVNNISKYSSGSHEMILGITLGARTSENDEPAKGLTKEAEAKMKADMEKDIQARLVIQMETKINQDLDAKINRVVEAQVAKALEGKTTATAPTTPTTPGKEKTTPSTTTASISKEELDKMKKDIEKEIRRQLDEDVNKMVDEKIKKSNETKTTPQSPAQPQITKEESEKTRKESEERIRKDVEEKLRKELTDKINKTVDEKILLESQKVKEEAAKMPKEYKMTVKDKALLDSINMRNQANEKKIADLEKQLKNMPESDRVENSELIDIRNVARQNDALLKEFKDENKVNLDGATDPPVKKTTETTDEPSKFVLVLACFKTLKEAQKYQKLAAQTFEFPGSKIIKPDKLDGWFFVYQKTYDKKKKATEALGKMNEKEYQTPNFPFIFVNE